MFRRIVPVLLALAVGIGCAGTSKLTDKSEEKLAQGDAQRAWQLATRALDKEPGNPRARAAATAAGASIAQEWQRRIRALAATDSLRAAELVLELTEFRQSAAHYATIPVGDDWPAEEQAYRQMAVRLHYKRALEAERSGRPKKACAEFAEAELYVPGYRDVEKRADLAFEEALTRVVVVPFRARSGDPRFGFQVARAWRDNLIQDFGPPSVRFTRILGGEALERSMTVSQLDGVSRREAVRLGRSAGAQRIVWGSIGDIKSSTRLSVFKDSIARRIVETDPQGRTTTRWIEVPIEVIARVRDVTVGVDYEVISTESGASIATRHFDRSTMARVVWTSYRPEGDPASYSLVSETTRASDPNRVRDVETRWKAVCGTATTVTQVLEARQKAGSTGRYAREALPRFMAGAAFVFLEDLPPAEDLALTALSQDAAPLRDDLLRLDPIDDVDLGLASPDVDIR